MSFYNNALRILVGTVAILLITSGCGKKEGDKKMTWRTDIAPVEKRIPLLIPIESCIWKTGQKTDYSGQGLPAPEEYYARGYIRISTNNKNRILKDYEWQNVQVNLNQIDKPDFASLADEFLTSQDFKQSVNFMRAHRKSSSFSEGKIILNSKTNILYFDLFNL